MLAALAALAALRWARALAEARAAAATAGRFTDAAELMAGRAMPLLPTCRSRCCCGPPLLARPLASETPLAELLSTLPALLGRRRTALGAAAAEPTKASEMLLPLGLRALLALLDHRRPRLSLSKA